MGTKYDDFKPNIAIPPGETLKECLENIGMTQAELSKRTGLSTKHISEIINGKTPITQETSLKLENVLGIPASFWNNLEANYQETKARLEAEKEIENEQAIAKDIPYNHIAKLGWVETTRNLKEKVKNLRSFFGVASLKYLPDVYCAAYRKADKGKASPLALATWLQKGEIEARKIHTEPFDKKKLMSHIEDFRALTKESPEIFEPKLKSLCASCGIALVLLPHIPKTYAHGATKWLSSDKALLQLSLRGSYADIFWFSFFHELGHIILHGKKQIFIEQKDNMNNVKLEAEADKFASNTLIPEKKYKAFIRNNNFTRESIISFADHLNLHPCIVIGRLQHDKILKFSDYHDLKPRFIWKT